MGEHTEIKSPVKLHRDCGRGADTVCHENLLDRLEMIGADVIAGALLRVAPQRTKNGLGRLCKELSVFPQSCEFGPDEGEQFLFESFVVALLDFLLRASERFGNQRGDYGFLGFEVVEESARGDACLG